MNIRRSITIHRPPTALYRYWHDVNNLAQLVPGGASVSVKSDRVSHWSAHLPTGQTIEWDAELTDDVPDRRIGWRSLEGATLENSGQVEFEPAPGDPNSTNLMLSAEYTPPGGMLGHMVAKAGESRAVHEVDDALERAKRQLESESM